MRIFVTLVAATLGAPDPVSACTVEIEVTKEDLSLDLDSFMQRFMASAVAYIQNSAKKKGII